MKYDEALAGIVARVRDEAGKLGDGPDTVSETPAAYEIALKAGLSFYSKIRPRRRTQTIPCGANGRILCSSITDFDQGFIGLLGFEYPIIEAGEPSWLSDDDWILDQDQDGIDLIRFVGSIPPAGALVRVASFCEHKLPDPTVAFTVTDSDMQVVIVFAAAEAMFILSAEYAQSSEHTILNAQISISINKSDTYRSRGNELRKRAFESLRATRLHSGSVEVVRG